MFIISFKLDKHKLIMGTIISIIIIIMISVGYMVLSNNKEELPNDIPTATAVDNDKVDINTAIEFIKKYGWKIDNNPISTENFQLEKEFDSVYKRYNQYQIDAGLDLSGYKGKNVKRYTFKVLDYKLSKMYEGQQVYADVIMYEGKPIAGDLKTNQLNGFMVSLNGKTFKEITGIDEKIFKWYNTSINGGVFLCALQYLGR